MTTLIVFDIIFCALVLWGFYASASRQAAFESALLQHETNINFLADILKTLALPEDSPVRMAMKVALAASPERKTADRTRERSPSPQTRDVLP